MKTVTLLFALLAVASCTTPSAPDTSLGGLLDDSPSIKGKRAYLQSPFVTAGDRVYMVGHQDGTFPEIGWHIRGEMGGIWNHPIKLMDGFQATLTTGGVEIPLDRAGAFVNFPMANKHTYPLETQGLHITRWQFVPDGKEGVVLEYEVHNSGTEETAVAFSFTGHADLRPTWLGDRTGMADGPDEALYEDNLGAWVVKDSLNPWFVVFGADQPPQAQGPAAYTYRGKGAAATLTYGLQIPAGESRYLRLAIAGSFESGEAAKVTYSDLLTHAREYLVQKRDRYKRLAGTSRLTSPDTVLNETFEWLKYNCDWLIREVPGVGRGIGAGIPDYPWWFGVDSEYALQGYMAVGQRDIVYQTMALLDSVSNVVNGNGRIIHEMSTNGAVFNRGNINETPQFAILVWEIYKWNGDRDFLRKYFPTIRDGLSWLMEENDANNNGFPDGFGMMEIHGLDSEMIDVASYTQAAFSKASLMARELGAETLALEYHGIARELQSKINREFWSEAFGSYADFLGTDAQALRLIEDAIVRADTLDKPWAVTELKNTRARIRQNPGGDRLRPFVVHHNWVVNTPMEMGIADPEKARTALETARAFTNPFGVFVTGIDRDASAGQDEGSFQGGTVFSYTGAVMTLPTGVQAVAENNYGNPDQALEYLRRMSRSFSYALPGSMYEVSPDYGMVVQAWNIYSFAIPIVRQFFGIDPMASAKEIRIRPRMPASWKQASLEAVPVGDNSISLFFEQTGDGKRKVTLLQEQADWQLILDLDITASSTWEVLRGNAQVREEGDHYLLQGSGKELQVLYTP